jgi:hypothetical protein
MLDDSSTYAYAGHESIVDESEGSLLVLTLTIHGFHQWHPRLEGSSDF